MILYRELIKEKPSLGNLETKTSKSKTMLSKEESFLPLPVSGGPRHPWLMAASLQSLPPQTAKIMASR